MRSQMDTPQSFRALQEITKTGCWWANRVQKIITFSSFPVQVLGFNKETLTFEEWRTLLTPEGPIETHPFSEDAISFSDNEDQFLVLSSTQGYQMVQMKTQKKFINSAGETCVKGVIHLLGRTPLPFSDLQRTQITIDRFRGWQRSFTKSLQELSDPSSGYKVVQDWIELMRRNLAAEYVHVCSFNESKQTFSCEYESVAGKSIPLIKEFQNKAVSDYKWMIKILEKEPVFGVEENNFRPLHAPENTTGKRSFMAVPLLSGKKVEGFIEISRSEQNWEWGTFEKDLFVTSSNIIGVCMALCRIEQEAIENNNLLHKLFQNMPLGYARLQLVQTKDGTVTDFKFRDVNSVFTEMADKKREELIDTLYSRANPEWVNHLHLSVLEEVARTGKMYESKRKKVHKNRYYDTTAYTTDEGEIVVLFSDVTHYVLTANELKRGEEELEKVYSNLPVGIEIYDKKGIMIEVNQKELDLQRVPNKETLLGRNLFDHPSLPVFAREKLKKGENVTFDVNIDTMKQNREYYGVESMEDLRYLTIRCKVLYNEAGEIDSYLLIIVDNTEIYEKNLRLREFESAFNAVAEIAQIGFFRWNPHSGHFFASEQFYKNMGVYKKEEISERFEEYFQAIHPEDFLPFNKSLQKAINGEKKTLDYELRIAHPPHWVWIRIFCQVTHHQPSHKAMEIIGINYNINEIKKVERKLIYAKNKAEESDRLKSAFLANMNHEVRNPLELISRFSEELAQTNDPSKKKKLLSAIKKNNEYLLHLFTDILELSRIESGSMEQTISDREVNEICKQEVNAFMTKVSSDVELRFFPENGGEDRIICSDAKSISLILHHLLSNAVKFTSHGHIDLLYYAKEQEIEFHVKDTGVGIDAKNREVIFDRYVKLNSAIPGTGLGLAICKSMVKRLGGKIGVFSEVGKGSCFWFTVPFHLKSKKILPDVQNR